MVSSKGKLNEYTTNKEKLFLLGESQGGCVAAITAPHFSKHIAAKETYEFLRYNLVN